MWNSFFAGNIPSQFPLQPTTGPIEKGGGGQELSPRPATVSISPDGRRAAAGTRTYAPRDVAKDLPVRVRTAYRTADGAGTDLSEIAGYTSCVILR